MANRNKIVSIKVDKIYFENIFEPGRKALQNKLGINFSQPKYTAYIAMKKLNIKNPKLSNKFYPKKFII